VGPLSWVRGLAVAFVLALSAGCASVGVAVPGVQQSDRVSEGDRLRDRVATSRTNQEASQSRLELARYYMDRADFDERGVDVLRELVALGPQHETAAEAHWRLAQYAIRSERYGDARDSLLTVILDIGSSAFDADSRADLGLVHERLADPLSAADAYQGFLARHATHRRAEAVRERLAELGVTTATARGSAQPKTSPDAAPRTVDEARRLDGAPERRVIGPATRPNARRLLESWKPSPTFGWNARSLLMGDGDRMFGGEELEQSLDGDGARLDDAVLGLGMVLYQMGEHARAGALFEKVVEMGVEDPEMSLALSVCYLKVGAAEAARRAFVDAHRLDASVLRRMLTHADSLTSRGDREEAQAVLSMLVGVDPAHDTDIRLRLERLSDP